MQIYTGMDVITNKVPLNEQEGVEHLLMGCKKPGEQYVVGQWVKDAIQAVCIQSSLVYGSDSKSMAANRSRRLIDGTKSPLL